MDRDVGNDGRVVSNFIIQALTNKDLTIFEMEAKAGVFSILTICEGIFTLCKLVKII